MDSAACSRGFRSRQPPHSCFSCPENPNFQIGSGSLRGLNLSFGGAVELQTIAVYVTAQVQKLLIFGVYFLFYLAPPRR